VKLNILPQHVILSDLEQSTEEKEVGRKKKK
jgi:hypothetical protein